MLKVRLTGFVAPRTQTDLVVFQRTTCLFVDGRRCRNSRLHHSDLCAAFEAWEAPRSLERAIRMGDWLLSIQMQNGAFQAGTWVEGRPASPSIFWANTFGLVALTGNERPQMGFRSTKMRPLDRGSTGAGRLMVEIA